MAGFEPQTDVGLVVVPADAAQETSPTVVEICLLACPDNVGMQMELLSVGYRANTLAVDSAGTGTILADIEFIDDSDSDSVTNLAASKSLEADECTALIYNELWRGSQVMDPGDVINVEIANDGTLNTASEGAAFIAEYRVLRRSGA